MLLLAVILLLWRIAGVLVGVLVRIALVVAAAAAIIVIVVGRHDVCEVCECWFVGADEQSMSKWARP